MIGPVHWGVYPGEFLELTMAVLVAQDHPDTLRRTPASGDGGIDLMIPDGEGYEVRQIKKFTGRLGASERRQVEDSWRKIMDDPRLDRPVRRYALVMPVDPTPDEQSWFESLTKDAPWPVAWLGETHWHDLASRHPHVIDYFMGGRNERSNARAELMLGVASHCEPLTAGYVSSTLQSLCASLNSDDPFYKFHISITPTRPTLTDLRSFTYSQIHELDNGDFVTVSATAKYQYSLEDSPIEGVVTITTENEQQAEVLARGIRDLLDYGTGMTFPAGSLSLESTTPMAMGGHTSLASGGGTIGPAGPQGAGQRARLVAVRNGNVVFELPVATTNVTIGQNGGSQLYFADAHNVCRCTVRMSPPAGAAPRQIEMNLEFDTFEGHSVIEVLPAARLIAEMTPATLVQLRPEYGSALLGQIEVDDGWPQTPPRVLRHLEDLWVLQQYARDPIAVPATVEQPFANTIRTWARLGYGTTTETWLQFDWPLTGGTLRSSIDIADYPDGSPFAWQEQTSVEVDGQHIELGTMVTTLHSVVAAAVQPDDDTVFRIVPGKDGRVTYTLSLPDRRPLRPEPRAPVLEHRFACQTKSRRASGQTPRGTFGHPHEVTSTPPRAGRASAKGCLGVVRGARSVWTSRLRSSAMSNEGRDFSQASQQWEVESVVDLGAVEVHFASFNIDPSEAPRPGDFGVFLTVDRGVEFGSWFREYLGIRPIFEADDGQSVLAGDQVIHDLREHLTALLAVYQIQDDPDFDARTLTPQEVLDLPIPVFGSPPFDWISLGRQVASNTVTAAIVGVPVATDKPVLAIVSGTIVVLVWFAKPPAKIYRRHLAERVAKKLHTRTKPEDFK